MLKFMFALRQNKWAHWQLYNQVVLLLEGVKPNWGTSLMGNRVSQSPVV